MFLPISSNAGYGKTVKVANQIIVALNIEAVAEALLFAARAGADPAKVRQALMGGFALSTILEVHGECMVNAPLTPASGSNCTGRISTSRCRPRALGVSLRSRSKFLG